MLYLQTEPALKGQPQMPWMYFNPCRDTLGNVCFRQAKSSGSDAKPFV